MTFKQFLIADRKNQLVLKYFESSEYNFTKSHVYYLLSRAWN
jgi:hypothetical protein